MNLSSRSQHAWVTKVGEAAERGVAVLGEDEVDEHLPLDILMRIPQDVHERGARARHPPVGGRDEQEVAREREEAVALAHRRGRLGHVVDDPQDRFRRPETRDVHHPQATGPDDEGDGARGGLARERALDRRARVGGRRANEPSLDGRERVARSADEGGERLVGLDRTIHDDGRSASVLCGRATKTLDHS